MALGKTKPFLTFNLKPKTEFDETNIRLKTEGLSLVFMADKKNPERGREKDIETERHSNN
jgi:hypothetical protein